MTALRSVRHLCLLGAAALGALSVACRLDMLLKPTTLPRPALTVSPNEVRDTALARSDEVRRSEIAITSSGAGEITWSASERSDWIRLDPREGGVPGTLTISLDPEDLGPGIYESEVTVVARGDADSQVVSIPVVFVVQRPGLNVAPTSITRSTNVGSGEVFHESIQIANSGTGQLNWTASEDRSWLSLSATSGTGDATLGVTISSAGLSGGTYREEIVISAPGAVGSPQRVDITLTVLAPGLAVSPGSIHETAAAGSTTPESRTLRVTNSGNGTLIWTATNTQLWLTLSKTTGGAPEDLTVTLNPSGLPPGVHQDTVLFTSAQATNGSVKVPVTYEITQPGLVVTPAAINATAESNDNKKQEFELSISNSGGGPLAWFASTSTPWISLSPLAGLAPSTLEVTVDPQGLSSGTYSGSVTVSAPGAVGSPAVIPVQLTITGKSCNEIDLEPDVIARLGTLDPNDCEAPHRPGSFANIYAFSVNAGETISIRMTAQFNAYLILTDGAGNVLAENDECPGEFGTACIRDFSITFGGRYLVEATSTDAGAQGQLNFTLVSERAASTPEQLQQLRSDGNTPINTGATIPETEVVIRGKVDDPNQTSDVRFEVELRAVSSPFSGTATQSSAFVPRGTTSIRATGLTPGTGFHWQARACDNTGRCSAWVSFGNNAESDADFAVAPPGGIPPREE